MFKLRSYITKKILDLLFAYYARPNTQYFKIATTEQEKQKIYKFRYKYYFQYYGRLAPGTDHKNQIVRDEIDQRPLTLQIYQGDIDNLETVMRLVIWQKNTMPQDYKEEFDLLDKEFIDELNILELGRLVQTPKLKNKKLPVIKLVASLLAYTDKNYDIDLVLGSSKPGLIANYVSMGLLPYSSSHINYPDGIMVRLAAFTDLNFKEKIKPPTRFTIKSSKRLPAEYMTKFYSNNPSIIIKPQEIYTEFENFYQNFPKLKHIYNTALVKSCVTMGAFILKTNEKIKIVQAQARETDIYILLKGDMWIHCAGVDKLISPGSVAGEYSNLMPDNRRGYSLYAKDATILVIKSSTLKLMRFCKPLVYIHLLKLLIKQLQVDITTLEESKYKHKLR